MNYSIQPIVNKISGDKQSVASPGFEFIDQYNHTIIITYGTSNRDRIAKELK